MPRKKQESGSIWILVRAWFVQANAWQATFGLSHDIETLARLMGGNDKKLSYSIELCS